MLHPTIKTAIAQTILNCPFEKAMIRFEQDFMEVMTPEEYAVHQKRMAAWVLAMDDDRRAVIVHSNGLVETIEIDVDRVMEIFDPLPN